jgi:subtilisin family serine protease
MSLKKIVLPISLGLLLSLGFSAQSDQMQGKDIPFPKQKALFEKLHVLEAWQLTKGSADVLVGVIDNGFDFFHPDLKERLIPGFYAPGGYHTEVYDNMAHGTCVASIIAAKGGQGSEMIGLAPECRVLTASLGMIEQKLLKLLKELKQKSPNAGMAELQKEMIKHAEELKKLGEEWTSYQALSTAESIRYLTDHGVKVINFSGLMRKSLVPSAQAWDKLQEAFKYASNKGVLIVSGAGNNAQVSEDYPGDEKSTIVVGAARLNDERWEELTEIMGQKIKQGSNFGKRLTVMAPAENIIVCVPHDKRFYASADGPAGATSEEFKGIYEVMPMGATSLATPIVTSLAALIFSLRPDLDGKSVMELIKKGCDDIGEKGFDIYTGYGRVNFLKTLQLAKESSR